MKLSKVFTTVLLTSFAGSAFAMNSLSARLVESEIATNLSLKSNELNRNQEEVSHISVGLGLDYGFSNDLSFGIAFEVPVSTDMKNEGEKEEGKYKGISDINLNANYRYLNTDLKADLLVGINYSGAREIEELSSGAQEFGLNSGGSSLALGTKVTGSNGAVEWSANVGMNYIFEKEYKEIVSSSEISKKYKSHMDFNLGVAGQYNMMPTLSFGLSADLKMNGKEKNKNNLNASGYKAYNQTTLGANAKYLINPDMMLTLNYGNTLAADVKDLNGTYVYNDYKNSEIGLSFTAKF